LFLAESIDGFVPLFLYQIKKKIIRKQDFKLNLLLYYMNIAIDFNPSCKYIVNGLCSSVHSLDHLLLWFLWQPVGLGKIARLINAGKIDSHELITMKTLKVC
jgi:hypothetical protein